MSCDDLRTIFISSTVRDLGEYRAAVQDALQTHMGIDASLSEDWSGALDDTLARCHARLHQADAYFGIFAYWYGAVPPDHAESITHLEFRWAMERWGDAVSPLIAVFMPEGKAAKLLQLRAEELFLEDHQHLSAAEREAARERVSSRLKAFHDFVRNPGGRWRTVNPFSDPSELRERAIVTCFLWQRIRPATPRGRTPSDAELGRLGRRTQTAAARTVLSRVSAHADAPAVALLVTGGEDAGQRELSSHLLMLPQLRRGRPAGRGRPSTERYALPAFVAWCAQALGLAPSPSEAPVETVEALAERVHGALRRQQLTLAVDQVERFPGMVAGFHESFWTPFIAALRARGPAQHRLLMILNEHTGRPETWAGRSCLAGGGLDCTLLVELPPLSDLEPDDIREWLDEMEVLDEPFGRLDDLVEIALRTPGGERDGTPRRVFARLRNETLWPDEEP